MQKFQISHNSHTILAFWDEKLNKNGNWPLTAKHAGVGLFHIYERSVLHRLLILTWIRRKRDF